MQYNIPIVVTGLPRSGTTTVAATLAMHSELHLHVSAYGIGRLECDELLPEKTPRFDQILELMNVIHRERRLLIKRPWLHVKHNSYLRAFINATNAKVIITFRNKEELARSWATTGATFVQGQDKEIFTEMYDAHLYESNRLEKDGHALITWLPFLPPEEQNLEIERICSWLDLKPTVDGLITRT